eukprot:CAMPEP_0177431012 /NCGR_PEP_ID=MMETSP0368-20130122/75954_1 /TAXON_ID=447022 ORGANISM="Scrippsiella hangoei-like, Strain SHHI-4" /NCGR_SAMPLE_ID=MMETSP0368 /ASSEMBLY_ACC=CAM_ASM_000363 /LENGTH=284 /DNA_ID=CAMNT_0018901627 /DNA_START=39 /DNA_END=889 /DNA_ORIENTATION=+
MPAWPKQKTSAAWTRASGSDGLGNNTPKSKNWQKQQRQQQLQRSADLPCDALGGVGRLAGEFADAERGWLEQCNQKMPVCLPSVGSSDHWAGTCRPCAWFWKPNSGCVKALACNFCHLCPDGELKRRKKEKVASIKSWREDEPQFDASADQIDTWSAQDGRQLDLSCASPQRSAADIWSRLPPLDYAAHVKNTFIHIQGEAPADRSIGFHVVEEVTLAGVLFSNAHPGPATAATALSVARACACDWAQSGPPGPGAGVSPLARRGAARHGLPARGRPSEGQLTG